ncbi:MAG: hypothetical protein AAGH19_12020 [Pseudomonadota bacterium]
MTEIALLKFAHVLGLVYWLGADLGVFYSSYVLCDDQQPSAVRVSAAKILFALDQAPRVSMTLMLPLGVHLAVSLGYIVAPAWLVPALWLLTAGWLTMVLVLHFKGHGDALPGLKRFDLAFRALLVVALVGIGVTAIIGAMPSVTTWAGIKLAVFGGLVFCGLMVRLRLKPFEPAFGQLLRGEATAADNDAIHRSIGGTRPFVLTIWVGLLLNTALGVHVF